MHEDLIKQLRYCANSEPICEATSVCPYYDQTEEETHDYRCVERMMEQAADAIDELSAYCDNLHDALIALDAAIPQWIPVEEQLPKINQRVIAMQSGRTWEAGMFQGLSYLNEKGDPHIWQWKGSIFKHIDYWMPKKGALPKPPTGCEDCKYWDSERCANSNGKDCHNSILWWPKEGRE